MSRLQRIAGATALLAAATGTWCSCTPSPRPAPQRSPLVAPPSAASADAAALADRPLYSFSEADLDRYLPYVREQTADLTQRVVRLARQNLGQPYEIYLLGEYPFEIYDPDPLYCLARSDCVTFCEHTYAAALAHDWWSYLRILQRLRYRDGVVGMVTRNHFTEADWNRNNAFLFEDLTTQLGGGRVAVPMHGVIRRAAFLAKFGLGQDIPDETLADYYIPKERAAEILAELRDADLVNIVRGGPESQWVGHTGLITRADDGTVNLLHSAEPAVREQPLLEYLAADPRCVGVKFLRLRPDAEARLAAALATPGPATDVSAAALTAAVRASPLGGDAIRPLHTHDWLTAMNLQAYRLTPDTPADVELQRELELVDRRLGDDLGIPPALRAFGVLDLATLRFAAIHPDAQFYGASVPKIAILLAYFETHPQAAETLDPQTQRELELMIKHSDNALAAKYSQFIGLDRIQAMLTGSRYKLYDRARGGGLWCGKHYGIDAPRTGDPLDGHSHAATVRQCLRYYLMLEQGRLVSGPASLKMKEIFAAPHLPHHDTGFVRALAPRGATLLRKSGTWEDWHLDTARVQHGQRVYLLAGMTHHPRGPDYLEQMAAAVDDLLCNAVPPAVYRHRLIRHETAADFPGLTPAEHGRGALLPLDPAGVAEYESAILTPDLAFHEVLASWNIGTPPGAGFTVEIRVGRAAENAWSPWLYLGDWGTPPPGERTVRFERGRVEIDYFRSDTLFDRVQYRLRATTSGPPAVLHLRRVTLCLSDLRSGGLPAPPAPPRRPLPAAAWQRRLPVPFRTQKTAEPDLAGKICSPACVAMVMAYHGVDRDTLDVARACLDPHHGIYGNWPRNVQAAYSFGVPGYLARFTNWADVERAIAAGRPLIASIRFARPGILLNSPYSATDGHLIVLTGFDAAGNVEVNDPAAGTPEKGCVWYPRAGLEEAWWKATGGVAYVLLPPE